MENQNHHFPVVVSQIITVEHWSLWEKSCLCHSGQKAERRQEVKIEFKSLDMSVSLPEDMVQYWHGGYEGNKLLSDWV